jgi:hypothetical protein
MFVRKFGSKQIFKNLLQARSSRADAAADTEPLPDFVQVFLLFFLYGPPRVPRRRGSPREG